MGMDTRKPKSCVTTCGLYHSFSNRASVFAYDSAPKSVRLGKMVKVHPTSSPVPVMPADAGIHLCIDNRIGSRVRGMDGRMY